MKNTIIKRVLVVLMVICLLVVPILRVKAVSATASVVIVTAVIGAMAAWGISTVVSGNISGVSITEYVSGKLNEWSATVGTPLSALIPISGIILRSMGGLSIDSTATTGIRNFVSWLVGDEGLTSGGNSVVVYEGGTILVPTTWTTVLQFDNGSMEVINVGTVPAYCNVHINSGGAFGVCFVSADNSANVAVRRHNGNQTNVLSVNTNSWTYKDGLGKYVWAGGDYHTLQRPNPRPVGVAAYNSAEAAWAAAAGAMENGTAGQVGDLSLVPSDIIGVPTLTDVENRGMILDMGIDNATTIDNYADMAMDDILANDMDATAELVDAETGNPPQVDTETWPEVTSPIAVYGLDEIFPFCIPFDIYAILTSLSAERTTPHFEVPFIIPMLDFEQTIVLDFAMFDNIATLVRTLELMGFIIGLAVVTRSLFLRG